MGRKRGGHHPACNAPADLAAGSAQRTGNNGATTNLLPAEYGARYHQQLVDRLWMRAVMSVLAFTFSGCSFISVSFTVPRGPTKGAAQNSPPSGSDYTNAMVDET